MTFSGIFGDFLLQTPKRTLFETFFAILGRRAPRLLSMFARVAQPLDVIPFEDSNEMGRGVSHMRVPRDTHLGPRAALQGMDLRALTHEVSCSNCDSGFVNSVQTRGIAKPSGFTRDVCKNR